VIQALVSNETAAVVGAESSRSLPGRWTGSGRFRLGRPGGLDGFEHDGRQSFFGLRARQYGGAQLGSGLLQTRFNSSRWV